MKATKINVHLIYSFEMLTQKPWRIFTIRERFISYLAQTAMVIAYNHLLS